MHSIIIVLLCSEFRADSVRQKKNNKRADQCDAHGACLSQQQQAQAAGQPQLSVRAFYCSFLCFSCLDVLFFVYFMSMRLYTRQEIEGCACVMVRVCTCIHACVHMRAYVCTHVWKHISEYIHTYIHTHTHGHMCGPCAC